MNDAYNIDIIFIDAHVHPLHLHAPFEFQSDFENWYKRKRKMYFITRILKKNVLLHKRKWGAYKKKGYIFCQFTWKCFSWMTVWVIS